MITAVLKKISKTGLLTCFVIKKNDLIIFFSVCKRAFYGVSGEADSFRLQPVHCIFIERGLEETTDCMQ